MTKTTLLAAASAVAMIFAGSAQAGEISGFFGTDVAGNQFQSAIAGTGGRDAVAYLVASEKVVSATSAISGTISATNTLTTPIVVGAGSATRDYLVVFNVTGATVASPALVTTGTAGAPTLVSNTGGVVTYLVSVPAASTVTAFTLNAGVSQTTKAAIIVSSNVTAVIGGSNIPVDSASAVVAANYASYLKPITATSAQLVAELASAPGDDDYVTISGSGTATLAEDLKIVNTGAFNIDLGGTDATPAAVFGATSTLTVRGPLISDDVTVAFNPAAGTAATGTPPANTIVRTLNNAAAVVLAAGNTDLTITNNGGEEFQPGTYTVTWTPSVATGFTAPGASTTDAGTIELEGTNFVAPWVSGTGLASSVIRVSNSNGAASEPVTVRMISGTQVSGGASTPFVSTAEPLVVGTVPARGDLVITSAQLVQHFGAFTRGDFRVTVNQDDAGLVAKLRNTRDGQSFEQSLAD